METIWIFMMGLTIGAVMMMRNGWLKVKEIVTPDIAKARMRLFHDETITHEVAFMARKHLMESVEMRRMLDYLVAALSDEANMSIMGPSIGPNEALVAAGKIQAAEQMAGAIDDLITGKLAEKLMDAERKKSASAQ